MVKNIYALLGLFLIAALLIIALPVFSQALSQVLSQNNPQKTSFIFQSQFSINLDRNFRDAKSEGCFILYDLKRDRYIRHNSNRCQKRFIPASTFKIFNSLVALQTKAIADENTIIAWNGEINRQFPEWNQDQTMRTAFKRSVVWFYQELARRVGRERMTEYIQAVGYGNQDISDKIDSFWLDGNLRISPEEQIKFLVKLYKEELPFSTAVMQTVKDIMIIEKQESYTLRGKTGWGRRNVEGKQNIGWYVGYLETNNSIDNQINREIDNNVYFYALNFENQISNFEMIPIRKKILYDIFRDLQLLE